MMDKKESLEFEPNNIVRSCTEESQHNISCCTDTETIKESVDNVKSLLETAESKPEGCSTTQPASLDSGGCNLNTGGVQQNGLIYPSFQVPVSAHTVVIPNNSQMYQMKMPIVAVKKYIVCSDCRVLFSRKELFDSHLCPCKPKNVCDVCHKQFQNLRDLKKHLLIHTWEKNFTCEICLRRFSELKHLMRHSKIHTAMKPFACEVCQKGFMRATTLKKHMLSHTDDKPFSCNVCYKRFLSTHDINRHIRTHTGEKPFVCELCSKSFSDSSNLSRHKRIHTQTLDKPYVCEVCYRGFSESNSLKDHMKTHDLPLRCVSGNDEGPELP